MSDKEIATLTRDEYPPEVRDLPNNRMRLFVLHYVRCQNAARASKEAGYLPETATSLDHAQRGYELLQRQDVCDAIISLTRKQLRSLAPAAIGALKEMIEQPGRDAARVRAVTTVLERTDAAVSKLDVHHTHTFDPIKVTLDEIVRLQTANASRDAIMLALGLQSDFELDHYLDLLAKRAPVIDADFEELPAPERDPDAELLGE